MNNPQRIPGCRNTIWIAPARHDDLDEILALFDEAVAWLVSHGMEKQWGTTLFSKLPEMYESFLTWIDQGTLFAARIDGRFVGTLAANRIAPGYVSHLWQSFPTSALYLQALTTARSFTGQGIGRDLLQWAEQYATQSGKTALWLDCWAENHFLCRYYEQAGFTPKREFFVGEWRGQLFEKVLSQLNNTLVKWNCPDCAG